MKRIALGILAAPNAIWMRALRRRAWLHRDGSGKAKIPHCLSFSLRKYRGNPAQSLSPRVSLVSYNVRRKGQGRHL